MSAVHACWPVAVGVHALTTLRSAPGASQPPFDRCNLGNLHADDGDDADTVHANRAGLVAEFGLPSAPRWLRQVHGTNVARFDVAGADDTHEPQADAAVTSVPGVVLAVLSADCMPAVFAARAADEVAVAHAGWRGLAAGVLEATLAAMQTPARDVVAWLGPAAGPRFYEVGGDVHDAFVLADARTGACFSPTRAGHWHVDLPALARMRLADAGVSAVHGGDLCTIADPPRFYSHRRDHRTGRMATLAWIQSQTGSP